MKGQNTQGQKSLLLIGESGRRDDVSTEPVSPGLLKLAERERQEAAWAKAAGDFKRLKARSKRGRLRLWVERSMRETMLKGGDEFHHPSWQTTAAFDHTQTYTDGQRFRILTEPYTSANPLDTYAGLLAEGWELQTLPGVWNPSGAILIVLTSPVGAKLPTWKELGISMHDYCDHWGWAEINDPA
ncbi:hypothetical protein [Deinococcus sp. UR1]|uniref:hypothetical protein n=1 Tax=Deinococcus sp. UR1 TaxID=1704277 RepID=UPI0006DCC073|nr:hypothetical protein [Deinococcus sp. UR1]PIG98923.1 hypothetical protein AMD26_006635 [Deinococcus sp. UR1]